MADIDINDIAAGEYELVAELWDERTSKPNEPFDFVRHRKGDIVTLDGPEAKRLYKAGAVVRPGEREAALAAAQAAQFAATLASLSLEQRAEALKLLGIDVTAVATGAGGAETDTEGGSEPKRPAQVSPKEDWVAYAVAKGMAVAEAEALTKQQLIELYKDS